MKSQEYKNLMHELHNLKKKIEKIDVRLGQEEEATITFSDGSALVIRASDAIEYILRLKRGVDNDGDYVFREIKDLNRYFEDERFLVWNHDQKMADASSELADGTFKFTYDIDELQKEFLLTKNRSDKKFIKLKDDYFHIAAYRMNESATLMKLHEKHLADSKDYEKYYLGIDEILRQAFRNDSNFIKNFANRDKKSKLNILNSLSKYISVLEHSQDLRPLFEPSGVSGNTGIYLVLESYRKYAEACIDPINFVRVAHELNGGETVPIERKKSQENKTILNSELGSLLDCFDPHIRNSESHLSTRIDKVNRKVKVTDQDGYEANYSYAQIVKMTNDLMHNLLPALMIAIMMESQAVKLILSYRSTEYITALLGIDNS